jgi:cellulose synthase/poly-beta-1,6-N-acetylglucosamine synthase-like glycosyltransferase
MTVISVIFWCSIFLVCYSYVGYGLLLYLVIKIRRYFVTRQQTVDETPFTPEVTFMVAAYNESAFIKEKILNTLSLNYPANKLHIIFITDGSTDDTNDIIRSYPQITLLYEPERKGKTMAVNRAMKYVKTPFVVFSDANTLLNNDVLILPG